MVYDATYLRVARQAGVRVDGGDVRADGSLVCKAKYDVHHTHLAAFLARKAAQRAADVSNSGGSSLKALTQFLISSTAVC